MNLGNPSITPSIDTTSVESLLAKVNADPANWVARKEAAVKLYEEKQYLEAADILWNAPEMPATDMDVAFAVKVVSRARPNRAIRLIYEVIRRNVGKPDKNLAIAQAMNMIGLPMEASRFYGAALASGAEHFDLSFEKQMLWFDDSGSLLEAWQKSDQDAKPPLAVPLEYFTEETFDFSKLKDDVEASDQTAPAPQTVIGKAQPLTGVSMSPPASVQMPSATALVRASQGAPVPHVVAPPVTAPPQNPGFTTPAPVPVAAPTPTPVQEPVPVTAPAPMAAPAPALAAQNPPAPPVLTAAPTIPLGSVSSMGQPTQILQALQSSPAPVLAKKQLPQMPPLGAGGKGLVLPPVVKPLSTSEDEAGE